VRGRKNQSQDTEFVLRNPRVLQGTLKSNNKNCPLTLVLSPEGRGLRILFPSLERGEE
jgi:hypothetical protein